MSNELSEVDFRRLGARGPGGGLAIDLLGIGLETEEAGGPVRLMGPGLLSLLPSTSSCWSTVLALFRFHGSIRERSVSESDSPDPGKLKNVEVLGKDGRVSTRPSHPLEVSNCP